MESFYIEFRNKDSVVWYPLIETDNSVLEWATYDEALTFLQSTSFVPLQPEEIRIVKKFADRPGYEEIFIVPNERLTRKVDPFRYERINNPKE